MSIVEQLVKVYFEEEWWHKTRMTNEEAYEYHTKMLEKGRIIPLQYGDLLIGYVESWRVTFEQFGKIVCGVNFSAFHENVETGNVCYLANAWIRKEYRHGDTYKHLKQLFFEQNFACEYFCGEARRKSCAPLKVFTRKAFIAKHMEKEKKNG